MAKIKYNIKLWADTAANLATDTTVYKENDFIFATNTGVLKKGDGVKTYANLGSIGSVATWGAITNQPAIIAAGADKEAARTAIDAADVVHDHAVVADEDTELEAAETLQELAEALSARIADLDDRLALIEETPAE